MYNLLTASIPLQVTQPGSDWLLRVFAGTTAFLVFGVMLVLVIAGWWKVFTKADQPGWAAIILGWGGARYEGPAALAA